MPIDLSEEGLQIQSLAEIVAELETSFRASFGDNVNVTPSGVVGQRIGIHAEREALVQQALLALFNSFDPNNATKATLDARAYMTGTTRNGPTKSKSSSFKVAGTAGTVITNGSKFQLIQTEDVWVVTGGPFVIGGSASPNAITAEAEETGPKVFTTTGPSGFSILTPIAGWTSVETTADIDPEDTGRDVETDAALRARRIDELLINGNDIDAIRAAVLKVTGVTNVAVFDNPSCVTPLDGIDPGAFEVVVDGGDDAEIAVAIYSRKPPGALAFGSSGPFTQTTSEGQEIDIFFTRPTDVDIDVQIDVTATGAEHLFPANGATLIATAALAAFNSDADVGRDIFPAKYVSTVFSAVQDEAGNDTIILATITMRRDADPFSTAPITISLRERADFDSANITVNVT